MSPHMTASISPQLHKSVDCPLRVVPWVTHTRQSTATPETLDVLERLSDQYMERDVLPGADVLRDALGSNSRCAPWWSGMR